jgi:hypothetical protein
MTLVEILNHYYGSRGLSHPDFNDAIKFVITEMAEACEIELARYPYLRNNPANKPKFSKDALATELGDAIMMLQVAGMAYGTDPLKALMEKLSDRGTVTYKLSI